MADAFPAQNAPERNVFPIPSPPSDWDLNRLLINIAHEMTTEDLEAAKMLFKGEEGLGRRVLYETSSALELFDSLQKKGLIDRDNLLYLQAMLYHIGKKDLFKKVAEYATSSLHDAVHFKTPAQEPENGYRYVRFHVTGRDLQTKYTNSMLQDLRAKAAKIIGVPQQFIVIAGIEPSSSLLITFMIPECFVRYLELALQHRETLLDLTTMQVDYVLIDTIPWKVTETWSDESSPCAEEGQLSAMYRKLKATENRLDERESECLMLKRQIKLQEETGARLNDPIRAFLIDIWYRAYCSKNAPTLLRQSALSFYKFCLNQVKRLSSDIRELILNLLDAHNLVVSTRMQESESILQIRLTAEILMLRNKIQKLEAYNHRQVLGESSTMVEKTIISSLEKITVAALRSGAKVQRKRVLSKTISAILRKISSLLTEDERRTLKDEFIGPDDKELTKEMQQDVSHFLECLFWKHYETCEFPMSIDEFTTTTLNSVNRRDLAQKFVDMTNAATPASSAELKSIQDQLELVLQKLEKMENKKEIITTSYADPMELELPTNSRSMLIQNLFLHLKTKPPALYEVFVPECY